MERLKRKFGSLKSYFVLIVFITFCIVIGISLLSVFACLKFREYLLPDSNTVFVTLNLTDSERKNRRT